MSYNFGDIVWARMPFSNETIRQIEESHRVRPYLLLAQKKEEGFYAFPMTSQVLNRDLENNIVTLSSPKNKKGRHSIIKIQECYFLPMFNIIESHSKLSKDKKNEMFKKLKRNLSFQHYPHEVFKLISESKVEFTPFDVVEHNTNFYMINSVNEYTEKAICTRIYRYPKNGTYRITLDGQYFFIDFSDVTQLDVEKMNYHTSFKSISNSNLLYQNSVVMEDKDITKIDNLEMGTILYYHENGVNYRMILLEKNNGFITVIYGDENKRFRDFTLKTISSTLDFKYTVDATLSKERLNLYKNMFIFDTPQVKTLK